MYDQLNWSNEGEYTPPTHDDLRRKYLLNEDTRVLEHLPRESEIREANSFLLKVGDSRDAQEWIWKNWMGDIIALIAAKPEAFQALDWWRQRKKSSYDQFGGYVQMLNAETRLKPYGMIEFRTPPDTSVNIPHWDEDFVPSGTGLYPLPVLISG